MHTSIGYACAIAYVYIAWYFRQGAYTVLVLLEWLGRLGRLSTCRTDRQMGSKSWRRTSDHVACGTGYTYTNRVSGSIRIRCNNKLLFSTCCFCHYATKNILQCFITRSRVWRESRSIYSTGKTKLLISRPMVQPIIYPRANDNTKEKKIYENK
jgi:hypothetical protein